MGYGVIYLTIGEIYPLIIYITLFLLILYILYKYCKAAGYIRLVLPIYHLWTSLLIYIYIRLLGILHLYLLFKNMYIEYINYKFIEYVPNK